MLCSNQKGPDMTGTAISGKEELKGQVEHVEGTGREWKEGEHVSPT